MITATDDGRYAVRVSPTHRIHAPGVEDVEHRWLETLAAETEIVAPRLVLDHAGATHHVYDDIDRLGGPRTLTVFTWLEGRRLPRPTGPTQAYRIGALLARLHEHAPIEAGPGLDADTVVRFRPTDAIDHWTDGPRDLLGRALDRVQRAIDELWADPPHPPHLLHGDFGPHNVLHAPGGLRPIDFQDLQRGFAVQDVAITLADMSRWGSSAAARRALAEGYDSVRPWPTDDDELLATLAAGRTLDLVNLGLVPRRPGFDEWVGRHLDHLRRWMAL